MGQTRRVIDLQERLKRHFPVKFVHQGERMRRILSRTNQNDLSMEWRNDVSRLMFAVTSREMSILRCRTMEEEVTKLRWMTIFEEKNESIPEGLQLIDANVFVDVRSAFLGRDLFAVEETQFDQIFAFDAFRQRTTLKIDRR